MHVDLSKNGMIDDLAVEAKVMRLARSGDARYRIEIRGEDDLQIEIWTTRKSRLLVQAHDPPPQWIHRVVRTGGDLDELEATDCMVRLEQMDRRTYYFGLLREHDSWGSLLSSPAYTKARVVATSGRERPPT